MINQKIKRRDFLKILGTTVVGIVLVPWEKFFQSKKSLMTSDSSLKKAKYFSKAHHLAG